METTPGIPDAIARLERLEELPTLPTVIVKLQEAVRDPNSDAQRVAAIIEDDPAIMARILKVVNSALYGTPSRPINSLQLAVARLGMRAVSNMALSTSVMSVFGGKDSDVFSREEFWRHCISTGIAVNVLSDRCRDSLTKRYPRDVLHLTGLLHDIGKILLLQYCPDEFKAALHYSKDKGVSLVEAENAVAGCAHDQVGAWLGMKWNLSAEILQVIRWHHDPEAADIGCRELTMLCHSANYICNLEQIGDGGDLESPTFVQSVWRQLGLNVSDISDIVDAVSEEAENSEVLLSLM